MFDFPFLFVCLLDKNVDVIYVNLWNVFSCYNWSPTCLVDTCWWKLLNSRPEIVCGYLPGYVFDHHLCSMTKAGNGLASPFSFIRPVTHEGGRGFWTGWKQPDNVARFSFSTVHQQAPLLSPSLCWPLSSRTDAGDLDESGTGAHTDAVWVTSCHC